MAFKIHIKKMAGLKLSIIVILFCNMAFMLFQCNYPETVVVNTKFTLPPDSTAIFKFTRHYFILVPGDTALFYGFRACTVSTNGFITSTTNDSLYLRTITTENTILTVDDTSRFVHQQLHQQSSTLATINDNTIIRYFMKTDSATLQVAYHENGGVYYTEKGEQIVMPKTLIVGKYGWFETDSTEVPINNKWPASPMVTIPVSLSSNEVRMSGFSIATRPIALPKSQDNPYFVNGNYYADGIFVKSYYTINGETVENSTFVRITGTVTITRTYFVRRGMIDQRMVVAVQKSFSDGSVQKIRETTYVARGPEGAKTFSDEEIP